MDISPIRVARAHAAPFSSECDRRSVSCSSDAKAPSAAKSFGAHRDAPVRAGNPIDIHAGTCTQRSAPRPEAAAERSLPRSCRSPHEYGLGDPLKDAKDREARAPYRCRGRSVVAFYNGLYLPDRKPRLVMEALCWSHARRKFFVLADIAANARRERPRRRSRRSPSRPSND